MLGKVDKGGHMYQSLKDTKVCVLNFASKDILDCCFNTIKHNGFNTDEITAANLTTEKALAVNAPRIKECFLNIECEYLWEHELYEGSRETAVALKAVNVCMDSEYYDQKKLGRYGDSGYSFVVDQPTNPNTGDTASVMVGTLSIGELL